MRTWILLLFLLLGSRALSAQERPTNPPESRCREWSAAGACTLYAVSMVELIASPQLYHGSRVRVIGYINLEFEGNAIYLHQEDRTHSIFPNGLWVEFAPGFRLPPECRQAYVLIEGVFDATMTGHMSMWSGSIRGIDRCISWD